MVTKTETPDSKAKLATGHTIKEATAKKPAVKKEKYYEAVGRRKEATARVRLFTKDRQIIVNGKPYEKYFTILRLQKEVVSPLEKMKITDKLGIVAKVSGGGIKAQAEAIRLGVSRALVEFNPIFRKRLRKLELLTRDARVVERKKYGLKKARRAPQWKKR
ncbi:30S ribosomal protein S9 [Candidatus Wolfebacteria bacterium]|nr:30S ribosomal protein S9 [Candidatus Wolfebacteria bacterium]